MDKVRKEENVDDLTFQKIEQSIADRKKLHSTFLKNVKTLPMVLAPIEKKFCRFIL